MPRLRIDNVEVDVPAGTTILHAARQRGLDIPNLCFLEKCTPQTSCLVCVVKVNGGARLVPSCATLAQEGMVVESEIDEVRTARRMALELLLADHAGDCLAPCQSLCPAHLEIPTMIRQINAGQLVEALVTAKQAIVLPAVLGRVCPQLCERGCRRAQLDASVTICALHRHVADVDLASGHPFQPPCRPSSGKRVAIVGAGPAGLAAAWHLTQFGHACVVLDEHPQPGGALRYAIAEEQLPRAVLDAEIATIQSLGVEFRMDVRLGREITLDNLRRDYDAVLLAIGPLDAAHASALGVPLGEHGLEVNPETMQTPLTGVFAAGSAVAPLQHAVRAVGQGRVAATAIDQHLAGIKIFPHPSTFTSRLGKLTAAEQQVFFTGADPAPRACPATAALTGQQAVGESKRCMCCDCSFADGCKLRIYAVQYDAQPARFRFQRHVFERRTDHPYVVYEPGKCIACGLCVQIAAQAKEPLGLTWIGRGFDVKVDVPFNATLEQGLQKSARECVEACPTGALAMKPGLTPQ